MPIISSHIARQWCSVALALLAGTVPPSAGAADLNDPFGVVRINIQTCGVEYVSHVLQPSSQAEVEKGVVDHAACVRDARADAKQEYEALTAATKKPKAKEAVKELYLAVLNAIDGIDLQAGERKSEYHRRQGAFQGEIKKALARLEVER